MLNPKEWGVLLTIVAVAAGAGAISAVAVWLMLRSGWQWAMDRPGARSLHAVAVPRTGGLGIMAGLVMAALWVTLTTGHWLWRETLCALVLCAVSLFDDRYGLPVSVRLAAHFTVAGAWVWLALGAGGAAAALPQGPQALLFLATMLAIVTMINFFNFMDGANGLAGGMAVIGHAALALAAWPADSGVAMLCAALAGAAAGFLVFNLPGRIFMGDGGSVPLGFLSGAAGVYGWHAGLWPLWFPLAVFAPFIVDAGVTLARRIVRREPFWRAHREHYYQRVVRMGASHLRVAAAEYALMLVCATAALCSLRKSAAAQGVIFATIALLLIFLMLVIDARWKRFAAQT